MEQETLRLLVGMYRIVRYLRRIADVKLHATQFLALILIAEEEPIRIGALAARLPCSQPTATTTVAALEDAGLVRRRPDALDRRATVAVLTPAGRRILDAATAQATEDLGKLLTRLTPAERSQVLEAGAVLARLADDL